MGKKPLRQLSWQERLELRVEMVENSNREIRHDVNVLKEDYARFVPTVQEALTDKIIPPIIRGLEESIGRRLPKKLVRRTDDD